MSVAFFPSEQRQPTLAVQHFLPFCCYWLEFMRKLIYTHDVDNLCSIPKVCKIISWYFLVGFQIKIGMTFIQGLLGILRISWRLKEAVIFSLCSKTKHLFPLLSIWVTVLFFIFVDLGNFQVWYADKHVIYPLNLLKCGVF